MEQNILNALQNLDGEVKATNVSTYLQFEFGGNIKIERGAFSMVLSFYARFYETDNKGVIDIADWDVHDTSEFTLNGLPISDISKFKAKLNEWGLSGIVHKLEFSNDEQKRAIAIAMQGSQEVQKIFGKKFKVKVLLSEAELMLMDLQFVVENFDTCADYLKGNVAAYYKIGQKTETAITLDDYKQVLVKLSK